MRPPPLMLALTLLALPGVSHAAPTRTDAAGLLRAIDRLGTVGSVLYVAAHPDDENTRLLAWLANERHVRAAYLSLTRGEGGQNLIGPEQAPLLGVIRTQELLAARRVDGAEQLFGAERDFGYSKSPEETLAIWGREQALGDVVWAIRRFRPDVIVTRFSPEQRDTHGHHVASAQLALAAFRAAADPNQFPEQLRYVTPWQARRIVWNRGVWGPTPPADLAGFVTMDVGGWDPVLGTSAGEIAARSRSMHKSQGFGAAPVRGPAPEYFKLLDGEPMKSSILDGLTLGWQRIKGGDRFEAALAKVRAGFKPTQPAASVPALLEALTALDALPDDRGPSALSPDWKVSKRAELVELIAAAAGLWLDAQAAAPSTTAGGKVALTLTAIDRAGAGVAWKSVRVGGDEVAVGQALAANKPATVQHAAVVPPEAPLTSPPWLAAPPQPGRWVVDAPELRGLPEAPPALTATFVVTVGGRTLELVRPVAHTWVDPVAGERQRPLEVLPEVTAQVSAPLLVFAQPGAAKKTLTVTVHAWSHVSTGVVVPRVPDGFKVEPASGILGMMAPGQEETVRFTVSAAGPGTRTGTLAFDAMLGMAKDPPRRALQTLTRLDYGHIPMQTVLAPAEARLVSVPLQLGAGKGRKGPVRVGYIPGAGDEVAAALRQAGYEVTILSEAALAQPLDGYQAIVTGVRAFNVNPRLFALRDRLLAYVERGGTLVVQYNTQNRLSKLEGELGPWPFSISQERVTEENAAVAVTPPAHAVVTAPNPLAPEDWAGWVQERGLYFADKWDPKYEAPLAMHDAGEPERRGGLLVGKHGKGRFVYTGLAFFRQLPAGVPGAFRLFANLLAGAR